MTTAATTTCVSPTNTLDSHVFVEYNRSCTLWRFLPLLLRRLLPASRSGQASSTRIGGPRTPGRSMQNPFKAGLGGRRIVVVPKINGFIVTNDSGAWYGRTHRCCSLVFAWLCFCTIACGCSRVCFYIFASRCVLGKIGIALCARLCCGITVWNHLDPCSTRSLACGLGIAHQLEAPVGLTHEEAVGSGIPLSQSFVSSKCRRAFGREIRSTSGTLSTFRAHSR